jgi:hypothetical protein
MRKIFLSALPILLVASTSFAQPAAVVAPKPEPVVAAKNQPANPAAVQKTFEVAVDTVTVADPVKGVLPQVSVTGQDGKAVTFNIASAAMIHDSEMKMVTLDKLVKGEKVQVKYLTLPNGVLEAHSIKIVK